MKSKVFKILAVMVVLVPLGLLTQNPAWGEWKSEYYIKVLGYLPKGMAKVKGAIPLLPNYAMKGGNEVLWYYLSAIIGIVLIFAIFYTVAKIRKSNVSKS